MIGLAAAAETACKAVECDCRRACSHANCSDTPVKGDKCCKIEDCTPDTDDTPVFHFKQCKWQCKESHPRRFSQIYVMLIILVIFAACGSFCLTVSMCNHRLGVRPVRDVRAAALDEPAKGLNL